MKKARLLPGAGLRGYNPFASPVPAGGATARGVSGIAKAASKLPWRASRTPQRPGTRRRTCPDGGGPPASSHRAATDGPDRLNAFGRQMIIEQREAMADFNDDPNVRVAIVTGAGRAFSGGADLEEVAQRDQEDDSAGKRGGARRGVGPSQGGRASSPVAHHRGG